MATSLGDKLKYHGSCVLDLPRVCNSVTSWLLPYLQNQTAITFYPQPMSEDDESKTTIKQYTESRKDAREAWRTDRLIRVTCLDGGDSLDARSHGLAKEEAEVNFQSHNRGCLDRTGSSRGARTSFAEID